jgi:hypothetical protein
MSSCALWSKGWGPILVLQIPAPARLWVVDRAQSWLDAEYNAIKITLDETLANIAALGERVQALGRCSNSVIDSLY